MSEVSIGSTVVSDDNDMVVTPVTQDVSAVSQDSDGSDKVLVDEAFMARFSNDDESEEEVPTKELVLSNKSKKEDAPKAPDDSVKTEPEAKAESFVFDKEKYIDEGITDEKALKIIEKKDKQAFEDKKMIGRQGKEKGDIKIQAEKTITELSQRLEQLKDAKPLTDEEYNELAHANGERSARLEDENRNVALKEKHDLEVKVVMERNKIGILTKAPDYLQNKEEIFNILASEAGEETANSFKNDPFWLSAPIALQINARVEASKENKSLKEENERLKGQLKTAPKNVINRIKSIGKNTTSSSNEGESGESSDSNVSSIHPGFMARSVLKELVNK